MKLLCPWSSPHFAALTPEADLYRKTLSCITLKVYFSCDSNYAPSHRLLHCDDAVAPQNHIFYCREHYTMVSGI